jgi:epoxide hydrolase 4
MAVDELVAHRMVRLGEVALHVAEAGSGPLVVLLHGFPDFWYGWRHQIPALAEAGYQVLAPDLRGFNLSSKPRGVDAYRTGVVAGDIAALIASTGQDNAVVVGHDWGAIVAYTLAMQHPDRVGRLVIANGPHPLHFMAVLRSRPAQALRSTYIALFQLPVLPELALRARGGELIKGILRASMTDPDTLSPADLARYVEAFDEPGALTAALNYYRAMGRAALRRGPSPGSRERPRPGTVQAPTQVIWGQRDRSLVPELAQPPRALVPDLRVHRVEGAGHFVQVEAPTVFNDVLLRFLRA